MNNSAYAKKETTQPRVAASNAALTLDEARRIYDKSPSRLDLSALDRVFATAPDSVETSGKNPKS